MWSLPTICRSFSERNPCSFPHLFVVSPCFPQAASQGARKKPWYTEIGLPYSSKHRDWDCIWNSLTWGLHKHLRRGYNWSHPKNIPMIFGESKVSIFPKFMFHPVRETHLGAYPIIPLSQVILKYLHRLAVFFKLINITNGKFAPHPLIISCTSCAAPVMFVALSFTYFSHRFYRCIYHFSPNSYPTSKP